MPDVDWLMEGQTTVGRWSLEDICRHLAGALRLAVDMPASTRHDPALRFDEDRIARVFATGILPVGLPRPATMPAPPSAGGREAADRLREAIAYDDASPATSAGHRFLGPLSEEQWDQLQLIHCAHHLSFAIPSPA